MDSHDLTPPGRTESVVAESVLVVAPHYDDEVLGCGGLVATLASQPAPAVVRVLFLTDGRGTAGDGEDPDEHVATRRREAAAACENLGVTGTDELLLEDGALAQRQEKVAAGLRRAILSQRPDLLLLPSPLEASEDHRATFSAAHRLLGGLRDDPLHDAAKDLRVLLWEANRLQVADLLVDVSEAMGTFERAMACYQSQEARHPYLRAALGLRRYRAFSVGPEVEYAEAYRRLGIDDFRTRGPSALLAHLGGVPELHRVDEGPLVSVVVRTKDRPELLAQALRSIARQTWRRTEVVVVNDGGEHPVSPEDLPEGYPLEIRLVHLPENVGRAGAAEAGVAEAKGEYVGFLDDDDVYEPEHLETLVGALRAEGVRVAYSDAAVGVYELQPGRAGWRETERRLPYSRDFDPDLLLLDNYLPFNTLLIERPLFDEAGGFDGALPFFEDWDFLLRLVRITPFHHVQRVTCEYRQFRGAGHHVLGDRPRERADFLSRKAEVIARHAEHATPEVLARVVDRLRAETVAAEEDAAAERERRRDEERRSHELNGRLHAVEMHRAALEQIEERLRADLDGVRAARDATRRELDEVRGLQRKQSDDLEAAYAEIARLDGLVKEMRSTRAWRLHERLQKLLGRG